MTVDTKKLEQFLGQFVNDLGPRSRRHGRDRRTSWSLQGSGGQSPHTHGTGGHHTHRRTLRARVAGFSGGGRLYHLQRRNSQVRNDRRAGTHLGERRWSRHICPAHLNSLWDHWPPSRASPRHFAPAPAWAGASTRTECFTDARSSFVPGYAANLVSSWIPALDGVQDKLVRGAKVADVGCGKGCFDHPDGEGLPQVSHLRI